MTAIPLNQRCKRYQAEGHLAESHIIPAAFFRQIQGDSPILLQIGSDDDSYQQKLRKGLYVTDILCPACDGWLNQKYERQIIQHLIQGRGVTSVHLVRENIQLWRMDGVDVDVLKLFLLSILWRAHVTEEGPCRAFSLGAAADRIQEMVLGQVAGDPDEFSVLATRFDKRAAILLPHAYNLEGIPYWEINLGDWHFLVKASREATPPTLDGFELLRGNPGLVIPRDFLGSAHHELLRDMVLQNWDRKQRNKKGH